MDYLVPFSFRGFFRYLRFILVSLSPCLLVPLSCGASDRPTGADFLLIEPSARAAAMGGSYSALVDDVHAIYYNPAGLARVGRVQLTGTHTEWVAGVQNEFVAFAFPLGRFAWGFSTGYLHSEEIERDAVGRRIGTFLVGDGALSAACGLRLTDRQFVGANVKFLHRNLYHRATSGAAVDFGYQCRLKTEGGSHWKFGVTLKNLGPKMGFAYKESLPTEYEGAVAYQPLIGLRRPLAFVFSVRDGNFHSRPVAAAGVEASILSRLFLRVGYVLDDSEQKLRAGFGVDLFDLGRIDFAAVRIGKMNSSMFLSLSLQLSKKKENP